MTFGHSGAQPSKVLVSLAVGAKVAQHENTASSVDFHKHYGLTKSPSDVSPKAIEMPKRYSAKVTGSRIVIE